MKKLTTDWVHKAEEDFDTVQKLLRTKAPSRNVLCFHSQQTAEK